MNILNNQKHSINDGLDNPQPKHIMKDARGTPAAQLKLASETYTGEEQFDPTRNLAKDLYMKTPAQKRKPHPCSNSGTGSIASE